MTASRWHRPPAARALQLALVALAVVGLVACGGSSSEGVAPAPEPSLVLASPQEAEALIADGNVKLLDVRTPEEFAAGHLEGAENIDFYAPDFADQIDALAKDEKYVVYCRSGNRSGKTAELMSQTGFAQVIDVDGGIVAWEAAGLPTVTAG